VKLPLTTRFIGQALLFGGEAGSLQVILPVEVIVKSPSFTVKVPLARWSWSLGPPSRLANVVAEEIDTGSALARSIRAKLTIVAAARIASVAKTTGNERERVIDPVEKAMRAPPVIGLEPARLGRRFQAFAISNRCESLGDATSAVKSGAFKNLYKPKKITYAAPTIFRGDKATGRSEHSSPSEPPRVRVTSAVAG
jgi:hypothetical protein